MPLAMMPNAPAPSRAPRPVSSTTGSRAHAHATARVKSSAKNAALPPRANNGERRAERPSDAVKTRVGHGRATTAGDTAVAKRSPEIASHPIAKSSAVARPPMERRAAGEAVRPLVPGAAGAWSVSEGCGEDGDAELMLLLQPVHLKLGERVDGPYLDGRHGDLECTFVE